MTEKMSHEELDNLLAPAVVHSPYQLYDELREHDPVHWNPLFHCWVITRYDDVCALLQDPRVITNWAQLPPLERALDPREQADWDYLLESLRLSIGSLNGRELQRQRSILHKAFTPRMVEQMRAVVQAHTDRLLDAALARGAIELVGDLAEPLPLDIIFTLCDIPEPARGPIQRGATAMVAAMQIRAPAPGQIGALAEAVRAGEQSLVELTAERRARPTQDLLGRLAVAEVQGQSLNDRELVIFIYNLLLAGFETITRLISNAALTLLERPADLARLQADPELIERAVEELLRFEPPVLCVLRFSTAELTLHGTTIPPNQILLISFAGANRDPRHFVDPDQLDLARQPNRHLSFGYGSHFCIGAALARLEGQIAISSILRRLPGLRLAQTDLAWQPTFLVRGLQALPLLFDPPQS